MKKGDSVEIWVSKSKLHCGYYDYWAQGTILKITSKRIKVQECSASDVYADGKGIRYVMPKYVRPCE